MSAFPKHLRHGITLVTFCVLAILHPGCSRTQDPPKSDIRGQVTIKGSNTFGEELAPKLIAEYRRTRPHVTVDLESKGSESGLIALLAGECDIAAASRPPTDGERAAFAARGVKLEESLIGYYGVAVIVHASNPIDSLTKDQVRDIFTGSTANWSIAGGRDAPIRVLIRDPIAGTNLGFRELAMDGRAYAGGAETFTSYAALASAVERDPTAIGYASMHLANTAGVKALRIGRVEANAVSVNEGWYPYARTLYLYTNKATVNPAARDFVQFVQRKPGQDIIDNTGFVRRFEKSLKSLVPD